MKNAIRRCAIIALLSLSLGGCAGYPGSGPFIGGVVGGASGAAGGAALCGYNPACMVVGSVVGAMAGGVVGASVERTQVGYPPPGPMMSPPPPVYQPGVDPAADAAYNAGRQRYLQNISRQRQAAAYQTGVSGY